MSDTSIFSDAVIMWNRLEEIIGVLGEGNVLDDLVRFLPLDKVNEFLDSEIQIHELYAIQD